MSNNRSRKVSKNSRNRKRPLSIAQIGEFVFSEILNAADFDAHSFEKGSNDDRNWFLTKPGRNYRLRAAYPSEIPIFWFEPKLIYILCIQLIPGKRYRMAFNGDLLDTSEGALIELAKREHISVLDEHSNKVRLLSLFDFRHEKGLELTDKEQMTGKDI